LPGPPIRAFLLPSAKRCKLVILPISYDEVAGFMLLALLARRKLVQWI
jgi:hypothetical protein